ncbi:MAG: GNAT family N-acyltransferase [Caldilineaceae bacterium]
MQNAQPTLTFKIADQPHEFAQIHRLNYETFTQEIPQHPANDAGLLIDKFHAQNSYFICMDGPELVGMFALRDQRPFSLDQKLANLDSYLPPHKSVVEIRLLAVRPERRTPTVFRGLMQIGAAYVIEKGYDLAIMSGTVRQSKLYRGFGFTPFGPLVGAENAQFQPMYLTKDAFAQLRRESRALRQLAAPSS